MNLKPQTQNILYEHGKVFQNITNLFDSNKLPNKILLSGVKGSGKATLAYHLINYIFSKNEKNTYNKNTKTINKDNSNICSKPINYKLTPPNPSRTEPHP